MKCAPQTDVSANNNNLWGNEVKPAVDLANRAFRFISMTTPFRFGFPQTVRRMALLGLGAIVLSSCNQNNVDSPPAALGGNSSMVAQAQESPEQTGIQQATPQQAESQPVAAAPGVDSGAIAVAPPAPEAAPTAATAPEISPNGSNQATLSSPDLEIGLTYGEARARLLQQGWKPVVAAEPGPYGVERQLYDQGITEVAACSGNAVGACSFEFSHPERARLGESSGLSVTTYGGSQAEIADWQLYNPAASAQLLEMPVAFQGAWDVNLETGCSSLSDGRIVVEPTRLKFYESTGKIVDISAQGPSELLVTTEMSGEGETWTKAHRLQLSAGGGEVLTVNEAPARFRCP